MTYEVKSKYWPGASWLQLILFGTISSWLHPLFTNTIIICQHSYCVGHQGTEVYSSWQKVRSWVQPGQASITGLRKKKTLEIQFRVSDSPKLYCEQSILNIAVRQMTVRRGCGCVHDSTVNPKQPVEMEISNTDSFKALFHKYQLWFSPSRNEVWILCKYRTCAHTCLWAAPCHDPCQMCSPSYSRF